jgi:SnoaL-like polyketide cyclase
MKKLAELVIAIAILTILVTGSTQALTEAQARAVIAPWYALFNQPVHGDMKTLQEQIPTPDYESCWGYLPGECWGRDNSIRVVGGFAKSIPDMKFDIKEVLVSGDRVIVHGEVTGTPAGDLFGVPHSGKSFRIMAIDIQTSRTAISPGPTTPKTGSVRSDSFAQSSQFGRSGENGNGVADSAGSATLLARETHKHGRARRQDRARDRWQ